MGNQILALPSNNRARDWDLLTQLKKNLFWARTFVDYLSNVLYICYSLQNQNKFNPGDCHNVTWKKLQKLNNQNHGVVRQIILRFRLCLFNRIVASDIKCRLYILWWYYFNILIGFRYRIMISSQGLKCIIYTKENFKLIFLQVHAKIVNNKWIIIRTNQYLFQTC